MRVCAMSEAGWPIVLACTPFGSPRKLADEVEVMDRMYCDLDARQALEEREQSPGRIDREVDLDVEEPAEQAAIERIPDRQHHRREAQLEIDRRYQSAFAADLEDLGRRVEVRSHRLLHQRRGADRQALEHRLMRRRRRCEIENHPRRRQRLVERSEYAQPAKLFGDGSGARCVEIEQASDFGSPPCDRRGNARRRRSNRRRW